MMQSQLACELIGIAASIISIAGVILNNRRLRASFALWWISNLLTLAIHVHASIWSLAVRDFVFFTLAVEGWVLWKKKGLP